MRDPRRFEEWAPARQEELCKRLLWRAPLIRTALLKARDLELGQWRIVAGALYNTIWNHLTSRALTHGINDLDLIYFDSSDRSYAAEDHEIRRIRGRFDGFPLPVELRNQARAHLWFSHKFGLTYPPLNSADEALTRYPARMQAIGLRLERDGRLDLIAPFGLGDILGLRLTPNTALNNRESYERKARRLTREWPEVIIEPWRATGAQHRRAACP